MSKKFFVIREDVPYFYGNTEEDCRARFEEEKKSVIDGLEKSITKFEEKIASLKEKEQPERAEALRNELAIAEFEEKKADATKALAEARALSIQNIEFLVMETAKID